MCPQEAFAFIAPGNPYRPPQVTEGVYRDEATNTDLFFITLEKSEREYSPSTLYMRSARSPEEIGDSPHFFLTSCRSSASGRLAEWGTAPYTLLGAAEYVSHSGDRPIQFVWRLKRAMPADFFRRAKVAAG